jgi:succinate dehydrogenase / fumarate reductase flavoprotein subunit
VDIHDIDVLIIGAGAAGARAAIELQSRNENIEQLVVGKQDHGDAHTTWARGGINAALGTLDWQDSWEIHAADTINEGHHVCDPTAVETVTEQMPDRIKELSEWGMEFTETEDELINQRYFGAQSFRRTCYAGDHTGESMLDTLIEKAQSLDIPYREQLYIEQLLTTDDDRVYGAVGFDMKTGEREQFIAEHVVLAAGGYAGAYGRHSSRDNENNGDSVRLAYEAGAQVQDMEFVQFHPTGMSGYGDEWDGRLVTEAVRGEGGKLYNSEGHRFMEDYSPKQMELDARDVVARAIQSEIDAGRGTENGAVLLDISHREREFIEEHLPRMFERFQSLGVDLSEEPVEVAPTSHYSMGGVKVDWETGETTLDGLYAIGEAAAGLHGANRLGGNSLAETVAMGKTVGEEIHSRIDGGEKKPYPDEQFDSMELGPVKSRFIPVIQQRVRDVMDENVNLTRTEEDLQSAKEKIDMLRASIQAIEPQTTGDHEQYWNTRSMIVAGSLIIRFALERDESRGAHYRLDATETDEQQRHNLVTELPGQINEEAVGAVPDGVQQALDEEHELDYVQLE